MSPIIGLSDRGLAFPEIGSIRKGAKKTENAPGKDLPYFRCDFDEREVEAMATFKKLYGEQPTDINIILPFNTIDRVWDAWEEAYVAGRMVARADGQKFWYLTDSKTGDILVKNGVDIATGKDRPYTSGMVVGTDYQGKAIKCKATGRLKVVLPELQRLAYLTVLTGSMNDIANISSQLLAIQTFCAGLGKGLGGTPLVLRRRPHEISCPDPKSPGKRVRRTKYLLSVEADPQFVKAALLETKRLALPGNGLSLPAPENPVAGPEWEDIGEEDEEEAIEAEVRAIEAEVKIVDSTETAVIEPKTPATRPWSAVQVKTRIQELVAEYSKKKIAITDDDRHALAAVLDTTLNGQKVDRYLLTRWLLDAVDGSTKGIDPAEVKALMVWQGISKFGDIPSDEAIIETRTVLMEAQKAAGQSILF
jgi:hypothetical protein